jgi:hypothetical protein
VNPLPKNIDLTAKLFPWEAGQPVLLSMPLSDFFYFPCFSSKELLEDTMKRAGVSYASIKMIEDGREFLTTFTDEHKRVTKLIVDPYFMPNGRIRFIEVLWTRE